MFLLYQKIEYLIYCFTGLYKYSYLWWYTDLIIKWCNAAHIGRVIYLLLYHVIDADFTAYTLIFNHMWCHVWIIRSF